MLALLLVAASLGMSNLAASIAIGVSGVDARTRLRVGLVFGAFEAGMPVLGLLIGEQVAASLGHTSRWVGAGMLIAVGLYALVSATRAGRAQADEHAQAHAAEHAQAHAAEHAHAQVEARQRAQEQAQAGPGRSGDADGTAGPAARSAGSPEHLRPPSVIHLLVSGLALSVDNLVVGFALGTYHISIVVALIVIGTVSVAMSLLGLELGAKIGRWAGRRGEQLAGVMLISVGIAIACGALS